MTLAGVYGFWKYVSKLERRETRRYLEMFYILKFRDLVSYFKICSHYNFKILIIFDKAITAEFYVYLYFSAKRIIGIVFHHDCLVSGEVCSSGGR